MVVKYNEFQAEKLFNSIVDDIWRLVESDGKWTDDNTYEWDIDPVKNVQQIENTNFGYKLKKLVSILPKEKIKEYYIRLINKLENLPDRIRKFLITHYTSIFLSVVSLSYLLSGSQNSDSVNVQNKKQEVIKPKLLKEVQILNRKSDFSISQKLVKVAEAGYSDDRHDRGNFYRGRFIGTNHGISAPVLAEYLNKIPTRDEMKNLSYKTAIDIFRVNFWDAQNLEEFSNQSVANLIYDGCVNQGVNKMKQIVNDAAYDNGVELKGQTFTVSNIKKLNSLDQKKLFDSIKKFRESAYKEARTWKIHGEGWMARLNSIQFDEVIMESFYRIFEHIEQSIEFYFNHLRDDYFSIQLETDWIRIFKPTEFIGERPIYTYNSCKVFLWEDVSTELDRFISEIGEDKISYITAVTHKSNSTRGSEYNRIQISIEDVYNPQFDCGEIISVTLGFSDNL